MSEAKHTTGPWNVPFREFTKIKAANGAHIATCHKLTNLVNLEANSRLIAAAPDLLEALVWMVENDDTNEGDTPINGFGGASWNDVNAHWIKGLNKARAAIAKATGGAA